MGGITDSLFGGDDAEDAAKVAQEGANAAASVNYQSGMQVRQDQLPYRFIGNQALNLMAQIYGIQPYMGESAYPPKAAAHAKAKPVARSPFRRTSSYIAAPTPAVASAPQAEGDANMFKIRNAVKGRGAPKNISIYQDPMGTPTGQADFSSFFASPDYQFRMDESLKALDRSAAARGELLSGNQMKGITQYAGNLASGEFNNYMNRLAGLAGIAQSATNTTNALQGNENALTAQGIQAAGDARASGHMAKANIKNGLMNSLISAGAYMSGRPG